MIRQVALDLRHAVRGLRRSPRVTGVAVLTLAVGIGVNAAVFTVANAALFTGFPLLRDNGRLVYVTTNKRAVSYPDVQDWRAQSRTLEDIALVRGVFTTLSGDGVAPGTYFTTQVTANTFQLLGVSPAIGRDFLRSDAEPGAAPVVILRDDLWRTRFGQDRTVVGRTVRLNGIATTIVGIMPRGFSFPENQSLWTPLIPAPEAHDRTRFYARYAVGRLAPGETLDRARAELTGIGRQLANAYPASNRDRTPDLRGFQDFFVGAQATTAYWALWGAVGFVLLVACGNVANLLLQQAIGRSRDIAIRLALGAGRGRLVRQLLIESMVLSGLAGIVGWWIAQACVRLYALVPVANPMPFVVTGVVNARALLYLVSISIASGLLVGLPAAARLTASALESTSGRAAGGVRERGLRHALVAAEMALTLIVLTGAGLMVRSFLHVYAADIGVTVSHVLTMSMYVPGERYPDAEAQTSFYSHLVARLESTPGVASVALGAIAPTETAPRTVFEVPEAAGADEASRPNVALVVVSPGYFRTLDARVLAGREFTDRDRAASASVAVVNQAFAARQWPAVDAVGQRLRLFRDGQPGAWTTVVGVVSNIVQDDRTRQALEPVLYLPYQQRPQPNMFVFARTRVLPQTLATAFVEQVDALDPALPVPAPMPLPDRLSRAYGLEQGVTLLFLMFAGVALLLALVGLYASVAYSVSTRTCEFGVRMALGATARHILVLVLRQGGVPLGLGLLAGVFGSLALTRLLESVLVRTPRTDPVAFASASLMLIVTGALGCYLPARAALRVDPAAALRQE